ncbi:hypothetical protein EZV77_10510 [Burkholderia thailandensis]|nr:hypothetical protein A8H32_28725 [Burkholderia thailandensis]MDD1481495.1 hypothetical protein [Burkholderia thailandensis]MDD1484938.1 hypothetical protein [Burkholderia thailandensis]MDD1491648.1 hypothetical protein [Burkholderia thailandensis]PJO73002.1 hypothetical protein CWD92_07580 [Burkholderia thailandensis]
MRPPEKRVVFDAPIALHATRALLTWINLRGEAFLARGKKGRDPKKARRSVLVRRRGRPATGGVGLNGVPGALRCGERNCGKIGQTHARDARRVGVGRLVRRSLRAAKAACAKP